VSDTITFTSQAVMTCEDTYRVIQEEILLFWEETIPVIVRKKFIRTCA
jgi:hypothetical protein